MPHRPHSPTLATRVRTPWLAPDAPGSTPLGLWAALLHRPPELLPRRVRRALQRQWRLPLAGVALLLALGQHPSLAATIPVGGGCILIDAITAANTDIATGGCPAGSGADTIVLPAGSTQTLTAVNNDTDGPNGLPSITSNLTIIGAGAGQTIIAAADSSSDDGFRLFHVAATGVLNLNGLTITGSSCACDGGGIFNAGTLTLRDSTVSGNQTTGENGGGIFNAGTLTLRDSTVSGNLAERGGGGISSSGPLTLSHSTVSDNASGDGNGGGISSSGPLTLSHSTVSGNRTTEGSGGGIAGPFGAGIAGDATLTHTIVAGNIAFEDSGFSDDCFSVMITSLGPNLVGVGCASNGLGDLTVDPATVFTTVLGPLQHNGGRTQTHALLPGSPAIDAGGPMCTDATGAPLLPISGASHVLWMAPATAPPPVTSAPLNSSRL